MGRFHLYSKTIFITIRMQNRLLERDYYFYLLCQEFLTSLMHSDGTGVAWNDWVRTCEIRERMTEMLVYYSGISAVPVIAALSSLSSSYK